MSRMIYILMIAALVLVGTVAAAPVLPGEFYGSVFLNGNPAPTGTVIVAKINGEPRGEFTTTVDGVYGGPNNFDPRLIVSSTEEEVNAGTVTITFFVGGVQAFQTVPFKSGNSEKLDLLASGRAFDTSVTTVIPTYASTGGQSGGSSGGGGGGYVSPASGTGTSSVPVVPVKGTSVTSPATTQSRSSVYANIDAVKNATLTPTVITTTAATMAPAVTTVPATTKKAGAAGPLPVLSLVGSIIAVLCIVGRTRDTRKRR